MFNEYTGIELYIFRPGDLNPFDRCPIIYFSNSYKNKFVAVVVFFIYIIDLFINLPSTTIFSVYKQIDWNNCNTIDG